MSSKDVTHLAWLDCETTGLDKQRDPIIEIAVILTDTDLNQIKTYSTPIRTGKKFLDERLKDNQYVRDMHTKNGLISCLESDTEWPTLEETEVHLISLFEVVGVKPGEIMIAGSGVAQFDQQVIRLQMPNLDAWFAYYPMDIGVIRRFIKHTLRRPDLLLPEADSPHRALEDAQRALEEARHYRDVFGEIDLRAIDEEG